MRRPESKCLGGRFLRRLHAWDVRSRYRVALHFVQDGSVPHHAEASTASGSCLFDWCDPLLFGNGSHRAYENYVAANFDLHSLGRPNRPPAVCGIYYFHGSPSTPNGPLVHSNPDEAFGWVDAASHESISYWDEVGIPTWLPWYSAHYGEVTNVLLPSAERRTSGFLARFIEGLAAAYTVRFPVGMCSRSPAAFLEAYLRNGASPALGTPRSVTQPWLTSEIQYLRGGSAQVAAIMLRDGETTAHPVSGVIWTKYVAVNGGYLLGFPTADQSSGASSFGTAVRFQRFAGPMVITGPSSVPLRCIKVAL